MTATIDLRSDTVTRPTPAMLKAMVGAELGDDVLGDDPTVIRLQERVAAIMGKEAACFVPSGTMANQAAIRAQTEPGDEIIAHATGHAVQHEGGAPAALSGVMVRLLPGERGQFDADDVHAAVRPRDDHYPRSRLLVIENTSNGGGGSVWAMERVRAVSEAARERGLRVHLDGARIWNACAASGLEPAEYAVHADTVSCCFSKGLGAPVGSAVAGDGETIDRVRRFRKLFGGAMRQSGLLAAAALHALDHHRGRLVEDHDNARRLAAGIAGIEGLSVDLEGVQTNIVMFGVADAPAFQDRMEARGVRMFWVSPTRMRAVTHLDVTTGQIDRALGAMRAEASAMA